MWNSLVKMIHVFPAIHHSDLELKITNIFSLKCRYPILKNNFSFSFHHLDTES